METRAVKKWQRVLAFCFAFIFSFNLLVGVQRPAKAIAGIDDAVFCAVAYFLISAGATYVTVDAVNTAVEQFITDCPDAVANINSGYHAVIDAVTGVVKYVTGIADDTWTTVRSWVQAEYTAGENMIETSSQQTYLTTELVNHISEGQLLTSNPITVTYTENQNRVMVITITDGTTYKKVTWSKYVNGVLSESWFTDNVYSFYSEPRAGDPYGTIDFFARSITNANLHEYGFTYPNVVGGVTTYTLATIGETGVIDNSTYDWTNATTGIKEVALPLEVSDTGSIAIDGVTYSVPASAVTSVVGTTYEEVIAQDVTGIPVSAIEVSEPVAVVEPEGMSEINTHETNLKALFISKFPFCLPFDLMNAFTLLNADPVTPYYAFDLVPESVKARTGMTGNTQVVFDLGEYEWIGEVSRWGSIIGFCIVLIVLTRKIMNS